MEDLWQQVCSAGLLELLQPSYVDGLSVLGGEPLDERNLWGVYMLLVHVRSQLTDKSIWLYTGATWEELMHRTGTDGSLTRDVLKLVDVLVDGPFEHDQRDLGLAFRGSRNQRIIDVHKTLVSGRVVPWVRK